MPRRSNNSFNCKLNQKYKDALKWKPEKKEVSFQTIANYYGYTPQHMLSINDEQRWRNMYADDNSEWEQMGYYSEGQTTCCGIDELNFLEAIDKIDKDTPEVRNIVAKVIHSCNNDDKRVLFTGLPLKKPRGGDTMYNFKNYAVLRKILLDFGFKQAHKRLYKNNNSENMLSVLVGQMP